LWKFYLVTHRELTRELETDRIQAPALESPEKAAFLEGFPVRYLRTHSGAEIHAHHELERRSRSRGAALEIERQNGVYRLTLVTRDRPFLLASIAGALSGFGLNILKAEGYSNRQGTVLDTFLFSDPLRTLELNPPEVDRLRLTLENVALGKLEASRLFRDRPKILPSGRHARVTPSVHFDGEASDSATLIQIVAQDRPGLLYDLARSISAAGCNVELVLIDTQAHKALDVFYVTWEGRKLSGDQQAGLQESLLAVCAHQPA
jgi:[protein-PII] uridylyltransferase